MNDFLKETLKVGRKVAAWSSRPVCLVLASVLPALV